MKMLGWLQRSDPPFAFLALLLFMLPSSYLRNGVMPWCLPDVQGWMMELVPGAPYISVECMRCNMAALYLC